MRLVFDRGTLLCLEPPGDQHACGLPGVIWDPRVLAARAPAWRYAEVRASLLRTGLPFRNEVRPRERSPTGPWKVVPLRPYQEEALSAWIAAGHRGLVVLPTGAGKTRLAIAAIRRTGAHALCLVPTRVLLHQWREELARYCGEPIGALGDGVRQREPITVATYESAIRRIAEIGASFDLIVVDEAHHFAAELREEVLEMSIAPLRLGLTATPIEDGVRAARLQELIGPTVFRRTIADLAGPYLAPFDVFSVEVHLSPDEARAHRADMALFRPFFREFRQVCPNGDWAEFIQTANRTDEGRRALAAWRRARRLLSFPRGKAEAVGELVARHRDARVLVFTADNDAAYAIAREHLIMPLTCHIDRAEREEVLERFRDGQLHALVSCRVLNEGLDVPDADVGVVVGGGQGEREHTQRVGRLLRPGQGKRAVVYELVVRGTSEVWQAMRRRRGLGPALAPSL